MRDSSPKIRLVLALIILGAMACHSPRWIRLYEPAPATAAPEVPAAPPPEARASRYLVISLARPGLHVESAERVARLLRDGLAEQGQNVTLAEDLLLPVEAQRERTTLFERLFHAPEARVLEGVRQWTDPIGADRVLSCMLVDYGEQWRQDGKVKRIVVQAACDDIAGGTRLARFQVVAERSGQRDSYSDVERAAARQILDRLGDRLQEHRKAARETSAPSASPETVQDATKAMRESSD